MALPGPGKIVVVLDNNGDENMQPCVVPIGGGDPEPLFGDRFAGQQVMLIRLDSDGRGRILVDPRKRPDLEAYEFDLTQPDAGLHLLGTSKYGYLPAGRDDDGGRYLIVDEYLPRDTTLWLWERSTRERRLLRGTPIDNRSGKEPERREGIGNGWFVDDDIVLLESFAFDDLGGLAWLLLAGPDRLTPWRSPGCDTTGGASSPARTI